MKIMVERLAAVGEPPPGHGQVRRREALHIDLDVDVTAVERTTIEGMSTRPQTIFIIRRPRRSPSAHVHARRAGDRQPRVAMAGHELYESSTNRQQRRGQLVPVRVASAGFVSRGLLT